MAKQICTDLRTTQSNFLGAAFSDALVKYVHYSTLARQLTLLWSLPQEQNIIMLANSHLLHCPRLSVMRRDVSNIYFDIYLDAQVV